MQKLSEKIKIMLESGNKDITWMNLKFTTEEDKFISYSISYSNDNERLYCWIDFRHNDKYCVGFALRTEFEDVFVMKHHKDVDQAWYDALKEFRTQTILTQN